MTTPAALIADLSAEPLALMPEKIAALTMLGDQPFSPVAFNDDPAALLERFAAARSSTAGAGRGIAGIPVRGIISQRETFLTMLFGGTSTEAVKLAVRHSVADPNISTIILDIDSPGGGVYGVAELGAEIAKAARTKRVVAQVNSLAASAGYWIASQAGEIAITPGGEAGSIGVYTVHDDLSAAAEKAGVRRTYISAGKYKTEGNSFTPLAAEAKAAMQARVDDYYGMFVKAVASGRRVSTGDVRGGFGQGRVVGAADAVKLGMADRIGTLDDTIRSAISTRSSPSAAAQDHRAAAAARARSLFLLEQS